MNNKNLLIIICLFAYSYLNAQTGALNFTLQDVIQMANAQSPQAKIAKTTLENKYWQFRTYKSNYLPQLALNGTIPDFNKSNNAITQPDGSIVFRNQSFSTSSLEVSLSQNIGPTGGQIFASSYLQRLDALSTPTNISYLSNPVLIGFRQPLFRFNQLK
ncbi:MAG TPA: hypothetical protein PLO59_10645 [Bacteroidia bacterium]|nr:hypothetical protein [Bacteroidia bacterium]